MPFLTLNGVLPPLRSVGFPIKSACRDTKVPSSGFDAIADHFRGYYGL